MVFDIELLYKTFDYFNDLLFAEPIPTPKLEFYDSKKYAGYFTGYRTNKGKPKMKIRISTRYNKDYITFCETLIHEMVHCHQFINNLPVDHGKGFKIYEKHIKKILGLRIR